MAETRNDKMAIAVEEWRELITDCDNLPEGAKYSPAPPFAFTEQGVAMLSSILNSERAVSVNIQIMRVFTRIRQMLTDNTELRLEIERIKRKHMASQKENDRATAKYDAFIKEHNDYGYPIII